LLIVRVEVGRRRAHGVVLTTAVGAQDCVRDPLLNAAFVGAQHQCEFVVWRISFEKKKKKKKKKKKVRKAVVGLGLCILTSGCIFPTSRQICQSHSIALTNTTEHKNQRQRQSHH
jgi:hypothetical protein